MKAIRNIVAHDYQRVDHEILWPALKEKLPGVAADVRAILDG
jgi:uncharacterized protein with HEPN domain